MANDGIFHIPVRSETDVAACLALPRPKDRWRCIYTVAGPFFDEVLPSGSYHLFHMELILNDQQSE